MVTFMGMSPAGFQPMDMQGIMVRVTRVRVTVMGQQRQGKRRGHRKPRLHHTPCFNATVRLMRNELH